MFKMLKFAIKIALIADLGYRVYGFIGKEKVDSMSNYISNFDKSGGKEAPQGGQQPQANVS